MLVKERVPLLVVEEDSHFLEMVLGQFSMRMLIIMARTMVSGIGSQTTSILTIHLRGIIQVICISLSSARTWSKQMLKGNVNDNARLKKNEREKWKKSEKGLKRNNVGKKKLKD